MSGVFSIELSPDLVLIMDWRTIYENIALVLTMPADVPGLETIQALVYGTVLCSLLVEGTTIPWLVHRLRPPADLAQWKASRVADTLPAEGLPR